MYKPPYVIVDFETECDGEASLDYYKAEFRVSSFAASWRTSTGELKSYFCIGETKTGNFLKRCERDNIPLVVHNLSFDSGVAACRFPHISLNWLADTMRLVQQIDAGGNYYDDDDSIDAELEETNNYTTGLSLQACISRHLGIEFHNHKEKAHTWLKNNHRIGTKHGKYLHLLPDEVLEEYNIADTENTLRLYEFCINFFKDVKFDWEPDHILYRHRCSRVVQGKVNGMRVARPELANNLEKHQAEIDKVEDEFRAAAGNALLEIEEERFYKFVNELKTQSGRDKRAIKAKEDPVKYKIRFNTGSTTQLAQLFVGKLGIEPKFLTKPKKNKKGVMSGGGTPSFKASHMASWGELGKILVNKGKEELVKQQMGNLLELSEYDNRFHPELKATGTKTNRLSGGKEKE